MTVLVVGYGSMGRRHAMNARTLGREVLVLETDGRRAAAAGGDGFWTSMEAGGVFTVPAFDAVVIATPVATHAGLLYRFAGFPTLVEKPLAERVDQVSTLPAERIWVGYNWRYHPQVLAWVKMTMAWSTKSYRFHLSCSTRMSDWPGTAYGDPLAECSHDLDMLRSWRSPAELHVAGVMSWPDGGYGIEFDTGDIVDIRWNAASPSRYMAIADGGGRVRAFSPDHYGPAMEQSYLDEMRAFLAWAESGCAGPAGCTLSDGIAVLRICEQVRSLTGVQA